MMLLLALAAAATPAPRAPLIDPKGTHDQIQQQIDALNKLPLPDRTQLGVTVVKAVAADAIKRNRCRPHDMKIGDLRPVTLDSIVSSMIIKGMIENGWLVSVTINDCPPADPIRLIVLRSADGNSLAAMFVNQGESLAWPTAISDALPGLTGAASQKLRASDPRCEPKDLTPTGVRVISRSPDLQPEYYGVRYKGSWSEVWQFEPCNHRIGVPIDFRADGKGGTYWTITAEKIVYIP